METRFATESPPDLDFGTSWARFGEVLGSIFEAFTRNLLSVGELLRSKIVSRTFQVRAFKKSGASRSMSNQVYLGVVLRAKTRQDAPKTCPDAPKTRQDAPRRAKWRTRRAKDAPRGRQEAPRRAQDAPRGFQSTPELGK